jgi:hypothetical protein
LEEEESRKIESIPKKSTSQTNISDDDVQARYEKLVKSGATAISSEMLFGDD